MSRSSKLTQELYAVLNEDSEELRKRLETIAKSGWYSFKEIYPDPEMDFQFWTLGPLSRLENIVDGILEYNKVSLEEFIRVFVSVLHQYPKVEHLSPLPSLVGILFFLTADKKLEPYLKTGDRFLNLYLIPGIVRGGVFAQWLNSKGFITPENIANRMIPSMWELTSNFGTGIRGWFVSSDDRVYARGNTLYASLRGQKALLVLDRVCRAVKKYMPVTITKEGSSSEGDREVARMVVKFGVGR